MSKSIRKVISSRSSEYPIQKFERADGYFDDDDGLWVDAPETQTTVKAHIQPRTDKLEDGVSAQRQLVSWHGWAVDSTGNEVSNKDIITIDGGLFTVSDMVHWPKVYREFDLTRSGEADNLDDT